MITRSVSILFFVPSPLTDVVTLVFFFFFSSRRRHTRFDCDWSSDVCSSDLIPRGASLTGAVDVGARVRPREAGASGYVTKDRIAVDLVEAIVESSGRL